ncbi:MAG: glycosyltransferase [Anaerolineaceae bacterium]|nr:glycosyltransferase [Anaerolineaceae bacterium]
MALVIEHLDRRRGGAEAWVHQFAEFLLGQGRRVTIVTQDAHQGPEGAELHTIPSGTSLQFAQRAGQALKALSPDTSLATGKALGMRIWQPHGGTVRGSQRQNVALVRSYDRRALKMLFNRLSPKHRAALKLEAAQFADPGVHFVAISRMVRRDMRTFYRLDDSRLTLIYNGVDLERFNPRRLAPLGPEVRRRYGIDDQAVLFLFVAHNFKLKGLRELLRALPLLAGKTEQPFHLLVVGRNRRQRSYENRARRLGVADRVTFAGPCDDTAAMYAAADVFVHPTWYDPCSLVMLEALASGLACISTRFNGACELAEATGAAIILDAPRPVARLAEAMGELMDPARREALGRAARAAVRDYPLQRNFREMLDLLTRTAESKPSEERP